MLGRLIAGGHVSSSRVTFIGGAMAGVVQGLAEVAELIGNRQSSSAVSPCCHGYQARITQQPTWTWWIDCSAAFIPASLVAFTSSSVVRYISPPLQCVVQ